MGSPALMRNASVDDGSREEVSSGGRFGKWRGTMKTSRIALAAAAGLLLGAALTPAKAVDLGGGCCADLEERVAELEATTARKGNRVVSLQLYGQVNKALLVWDDGIDSDAYVVDNTLASSRIGLVGKAAIKPGLIAGYNIEFEIADARADRVTQNGWWGKDGDDADRSAFDNYFGGDGNEDTLRLRQNNFYLEDQKLGRITVGQAEVATDGVTEVVLGSSLRNSDSNIGASFQIRSKSNLSGRFGFLNRTRDQWAWNMSGPKETLRTNDIIRYDSPTIYGFILSASWGDNDFADVALRFKKELGTFRVAGAIGYQWDGQNGNVFLYGADRDDDYDSRIFSGSFSIMHTPTGLYGAFAAGKRDFDSATMQDDSFWYLQGGIERKWMPFGSTTVYGEYGKYDNFSKCLNNGATRCDGGGGAMDDSEATRWGFGVNQKIDAAAMDVYAHATVWSFDDNYAKENNIKYEDLTTIMLGSRIQF
jgi:predicted porin